MKSSLITKKTIFIALLLALVVCCAVLAVLSIPTQTANANSTNPTANVGELWSSNAINKTNLQTLINKVAGSSTNVAVDKITGITNDGKSLVSSNIVVTLGGKNWIVVYASTANTSLGTVSSNGSVTGNTPSNGDIILTLWQAYPDETSQWNTWNSGATSTTPANMYGNSYIRAVTLGNGGKYVTSAGATSTATAGSGSYSTFQSSTGLGQYLVAPRYMKWQKEESALNSTDIGYRFNNESWNLGGTGSAGSYLGNTYYNSWANDLVWLPSLSETGYSDTYTGLWKTTSTIRSNPSYAWLRSAHYNVYTHSYYLNSSGGYNKNLVNSIYGVRPALHFNLTAAAKEVALSHTTHTLEWKTDGTYHWQACTGCTYTTTKQAHSWSATSWTWTPSSATQAIKPSSVTATANVKCSTCSKTVNNVAATVTAGTYTAPGCITTGSAPYTAKLSSTYGSLSTTKTYTISATGHTFGSTAHNPATCTASGYSDYKQCTAQCKLYFATSEGTTSKNGKALSTFAQAATGHKFTDTVAKAATCLTAGTQGYRYCSACTKYFALGQPTNSTAGKDNNSSFVVNATGHSFGTTVHKPATCTSPGYSDYKQCNNSCKLYFAGGEGTSSTNGKSDISSFAQAATGHALQLVNGNNTMHWQACQNCTYTTDYNDHTWQEQGSWQGWPEKIDNSYTIEKMLQGLTLAVKCSCGATDTLYAQDNGSVLTPAKCTSVGSAQIKITASDKNDNTHTANKSYTLEKIAHIFGGEWHSDGVSGHYQLCTMCNMAHSANSQHNTEYHADNYNHWLECKDCTYSEENTNAVAHVVSEWSNGATSNKHTGTCTICRNTVTESHTLGKWQVDDQDKLYKQCTANGCTYDTEHLEFGSSHTHRWAEDLQYNGAEHWKECIDCGAREDVNPHSFSEWQIQDGTHYRYCTDEECNYVSNKTSHTPGAWESDGNTHTQKCIVCQTQISEHTGSISYGVPVDGTNQHKGPCDICGLEVIGEHSFIDTDGHDITGHWNAECMECGAKQNFTAHDFNNTENATWVWKNDGSKHWQECITCNERYGERDHIYTYCDDNNGKHYQLCLACGATTEAEEHNISKVAEVAATCTSDGTQAYYICLTCGNVYIDSNATIKIDNLNEWLEGEGKIDAVGSNHDYDNKGVCKNCGVLSPDVQQDLQKKLEEAQKKLEEMIKELQDKKEQQGGTLSEEDQKKLEELEKALDELQKALDDLQNANNGSGNAGDIVDSANGALGGAADAMDDGTLKEAKDKALEELEREYNEKRAEIEDRDISEPQKGELLGQLESQYEEAKKDIENATTPDEVGEALENAQKGMEDTAKKAELVEAKQKALDELEKEYEEKKKEIEDNKDLDDDKKQELLDQLEDQYKKAKGEIENAETPDDIQDALAKGKEALADPELADAKDKALEDLENAKKEAEEKIKKDPKLTDEEKEKRLGELEKEYEDAKKKIEQAVTPEEARQAAENGVKNIGEVVTDLDGTVDGLDIGVAIISLSAQAVVIIAAFFLVRRKRV